MKADTDSGLGVGQEGGHRLGLEIGHEGDILRAGYWTQTRTGHWMQRRTEMQVWTLGKEGGHRRRTRHWT